MNKQLQVFFDNTKQIHIFLSIALLLIIIVRVAPIGKGFFNYCGQSIIIVLLIYILFTNFIETHHFVQVQKQMEKKRLRKKKGDDDDEDKEEHISNATMIDIKNNTIASYVLCGFIFILLVYLIFSLFD